MIKGTNLDFDINSKENVSTILNALHAGGTGYRIICERSLVFLIGSEGCVKKYMEDCYLHEMFLANVSAFDG